MRVIRARTAGFCMGVSLALRRLNAELAAFAGREEDPFESPQDDSIESVHSQPQFAEHQAQPIPECMPQFIAQAQFVDGTGESERQAAPTAGPVRGRLLTFGPIIHNPWSWKTMPGRGFLVKKIRLPWSGGILWCPGARCTARGGRGLRSSGVRWTRPALK